MEYGSTYLLRGGKISVVRATPHLSFLYYSHSLKGSSLSGEPVKLRRCRTVMTSERGFIAAHITWMLGHRR